MTDHWLSNLGPIVTFLIVLAALARRTRWGDRPRRQPAAGRNSLVPTRTAAASPPAAAPPLARRRLAAPPAPAPAAPPRPRPAPAPAMGDMGPAEAAAAFPALDLSLGDGGVPGAAVAPRRRARGIAGAAVGSRAWGANAIVAAEILGTPVGLRPGATVGVPHAF